MTTNPPGPPEPRRPGRLARSLPGLAIAALLGCVVDREVGAWEARSWSGLAIALAGSGLVISLIRPHRLHIAGAAAISCAFALGGAWHHHRWSDLAPDDLARRDWGDRNPVALRGEVASVPEVGRASSDGLGRTRALLDVRAVRDGLDWRPASGRLAVSVRGDASRQLIMGEPVDLVGQLMPIAGPLNPGESDERERWRSQGVRLRLAIDFPEDVRPDPEGIRSHWRSWLGRARSRSQELLLDRMPYDTAGLAVALLLGRRDDVEPAVQEGYARTGTLHVLAISGLHFQALALAAWLILRMVRLGPLAASGLVAAGALGYTALVGPAPSIARASAMTLVGCLAVARNRPIDPANILALAVLVVIALDPTAPFQAGCQLSFVGVAAIFWGFPAALGWLTRPLTPLDRVERRYEPRPRAAIRWGEHRVRDALLVSLVIWLVTFPLTLWWFHLASPIGIILNLPVIPLTSLALFFAGLALALAWIWGPLAAPWAWLCGRFLEWSTAIVRWGDGLEWGAAYLPSPPWWWALGMLAAFAGLWSIRGRAGWALGVLTLGWGTLGAWFILTPIHPDRPEALFLAVGSGQSAILHDPSGHVALFDCGRQGDRSVGRRIIAPALWERRIRTIDCLVLSGTDSGQASGLDDLLDRFRVRRALLATDWKPGGGLVLEKLEARGVRVEMLADGMTFPWGDGGECVVRLAGQGVVDAVADGKVLRLTGVVDVPGLVTLAAQPDGDCDAILAPRHGARAANPGWFYDWCRPSLVVVSQDRRAAGGEPAWDRLGATTWRTSDVGAVRLIWAADGLMAGGFLR